MATKEETIILPPPDRAWLDFAYAGYARIAVRKHNLPPPPGIVADLSDEEVDRRVALLRDLAHLPPG